MSKGTYDAEKNGQVIRDIFAKPIYVTDETARDALKNVSPGQIVATYGLTVIWQRTGAGTWATVKDRR